MSDTPSIEACNIFVAILGRSFARTVTGLLGVEWQVEVAASQTDPLSILSAPIGYRISFANTLQGDCWIVLAEEDLARFSALGPAADKDAQATAMLELMQGMLVELQGELSAQQGPVTLEVELAVPPLPQPAHAIELRARDPQGTGPVILLHFEAALLASFATVAWTGEAGEQSNLDLVMDVELSVTLRFGQRQLTLREILDLASGSVVELDRQVDEPVELILDGKVIARGEAVLIDGHYGLRVTQVLHPVAC